MLTRQISLVLFLALAIPAVARAGQADELYNKATESYNREEYDKAIEGYEEIVTKYASSTIIDATRLNLGRCYLYSGKYDKAVDILTKAIAKGVPDDIREAAYFYLGQAQLSQAGALAPAERSKKLADAVASFSEQLKSFPKSAAREDSLYNRALSNFFLEKYEDSEKDFETLIGEFSSSPNKADYVFWKGRTYASRAYKADAKKAKEEAATWAKKAKDVFNSITAADSPIVDNDTNMEAADLDFYLLDKEQYPQVIEEFNKVRRKADLIPDQEAKINGIRAQYADAARAQNKDLMNKLDRLRSREQSRMNDLQNRIDPVIKAAIHKAQCYIMLEQYDEARVLLRRLKPYATDDDDKKGVALQTVMSLAYQKLVPQANASLDDYMKAFPSDKEADNVSLTIGNALMERKQYQEAFEQFERSLKDFPQGRYVEQATLQKAAAMVSLGDSDKAVAILSDFIAKNPKSPNMPRALFTMGATQSAMKKYEDAAKSFRQVRDNPAADTLIPSAHFQLAFSLFSAQKLDEALTEFRSYLQKYPNDPTASTAALYVALILDQKKDPGAMAAFEDMSKKYPKDPLASYALNYVAIIYKRENKPEQMVAAFEKVYKTFPESKEAYTAKNEVAGYYNRIEKFPEADKIYWELINDKNEPAAAFAAWSDGDMWYRAAKKFGAYTRVTPDEQKQIRERIDASEKAYVTLLKKYPQANESARALQSLLDLALLRVEYTLLTDEQTGKYFADISAQMSDLVTKARIQLLEAALPYEEGKRDAAFAAYKKVLQSNPDIPFTPGDARRYGELLLQNNLPDEALNLFAKLEKNSDPKDKLAQAEVCYGIGAASYAKKEYDKAKTYLQRLIKEYGWHPKSADGQLMLAQIAIEQKDLKAAGSYLVLIIRSPRSSAELKGRALIVYGDMLALDKTKLVPATPTGKSDECAVGYYFKADTYYGDAQPEIGGEALWKAGQAYEQAGQPAEARKQYEDLAKKYGKTSFASKAADRLKALPAPAAK